MQKRLVSDDNPVGVVGGTASEDDVGVYRESSEEEEDVDEADLFSDLYSMIVACKWPQLRHQLQVRPKHSIVAFCCYRLPYKTRMNVNSNLRESLSRVRILRSIWRHE